MQVNFSGAEYDLLLDVAHQYGHMPARMVHDWVMERLGIEFAALKVQRVEHSILAEHGIPCPAKMPCDTGPGERAGGRD